MLVVKNINPGLAPSNFGGAVNESFKTTLHGYAVADAPVTLGSNLVPDKRGTDFSQVTPFFNQITYMAMQDTDEPCKGVRDVFTGMDMNPYNRVKQISVGPQLGGSSAVPQPLPNMRGNAVGLAHTQLDIEGSNMRLLPSVNFFDITKENTISDKF